MYRKLNRGWKRKSLRNVRRNVRYPMYYKRLMDEINSAKWETLQKRLYRLRKQLKKMGSIPNRTSQLISTFKWLVEFVNIVTKFYDDGLIQLNYLDKTTAIEELNELIVTIMRRGDYVTGYCNHSRPGETVNFENLYLGQAISCDEINLDEFSNPRKLEVDGECFYVIIEMQPVSQWIRNATLSRIMDQKLLADLLKISLEQLVFCINEVLLDS